MASAKKIRRRMSVDDANADLVHHVQETIDRLSSLWDKVSMDQATREKRTESAYSLFYSTMNEIVQNEEEMVKGVFEDIAKDLSDVNSTRAELDLQIFPVDKYAPNSIALLKALDKDKKSLQERKAQAMARQLEEYNELVKLCRCLGETVPVFESVEDKIMPRSKVDEIVKQRLSFNKELNLRRTNLHDLQNKVNRRFTVVKTITLTDDERELLILNLADPNMVFSQQLVQRFNDLLEKFESEYEKWRENIVFQYLEAYTELSTLADKCYAQNLLASYPDTIDLDIHDEGLLQKIQFDVQVLQKRYESGKTLFDKFGEWHTAFKKQADIEAELNTDRVRKNRGGCMTVVLRDQKTNNANFAHYLSELQTLCNESSDLGVTIDGLNVYEFALSLIQEREQQKENEKELKKLNKAKQLQMESRFGTSARSPSVKSVAGQESRFMPKSPFTKSPGRAQFTKSPHAKSQFTKSPSRNI